MYLIITTYPHSKNIETEMAFEVYNSVPKLRSNFIVLAFYIYLFLNFKLSDTFDLVMIVKNRHSSNFKCKF